MAKRILVTGSRTWTNDKAILDALISWTMDLGGRDFVVVQGGARGADKYAINAAVHLGLQYETHKASDFLSPRDRNRYMVDLGADICLAFARTWRSGTGMCARMARRAGIPTYDYGISTVSKEYRRRIEGQ